MSKKSKKLPDLSYLNPGAKGNYANNYPYSPKGRYDDQDQIDDLPNLDKLNPLGSASNPPAFNPESNSISNGMPTPSAPLTTEDDDDSSNATSTAQSDPGTYVYTFKSLDDFLTNINTLNNEGENYIGDFNEDYQLNKFRSLTSHWASNIRAIENKMHLYGRKRKLKNITVTVNEITQTISIEAHSEDDEFKYGWWKTKIPMALGGGIGFFGGLGGAVSLYTGTFFTAIVPAAFGIALGGAVAGALVFTACSWLIQRWRHHMKDAEYTDSYTKLGKTPESAHNLSPQRAPGLANQRSKVQPVPANQRPGNQANNPKEPKRPRGNDLVPVAEKERNRPKIAQAAIKNTLPSFDDIVAQNPAPLPLGSHIRRLSHNKPGADDHHDQVVRIFAAAARGSASLDFDEFDLNRGAKDVLDALKNLLKVADPIPNNHNDELQAYINFIRLLHWTMPGQVDNERLARLQAVEQLNARISPILQANGNVSKADVQALHDEYEHAQKTQVSLNQAMRNNADQCKLLEIGVYLYQTQEHHEQLVTTDEGQLEAKLNTFDGIREHLFMISKLLNVASRREGSIMKNPLDLSPKDVVGFISALKSSHTMSEFKPRVIFLTAILPLDPRLQRQLSNQQSDIYKYIASFGDLSNDTVAVLVEKPKNKAQVPVYTCLANSLVAVLCPDSKEREELYIKTCIQALSAVSGRSISEDDIIAKLSPGLVAASRRLFLPALNRNVESDTFYTQMLIEFYNALSTLSQKKQKDQHPEMKLVMRLMEVAFIGNEAVRRNRYKAVAAEYLGNEKLKNFADDRFLNLAKKILSSVPGKKILENNAIPIPQDDDFDAVAETLTRVLFYYKRDLSKAKTGSKQKARFGAKDLGDDDKLKSQRNLDIGANHFKLLLQQQELCGKGGMHQLSENASFAITQWLNIVLLERGKNDDPYPTVNELMHLLLDFANSNVAKISDFIEGSQKYRNIDTKDKIISAFPAIDKLWQDVSQRGIFGDILSKKIKRNLFVPTPNLGEIGKILKDAKVEIDLTSDADERKSSTHHLTKSDSRSLV